MEIVGNIVVPSSSVDSCLRAMTWRQYQLLVIASTVAVEDRALLADASRKIRPEARIVSIDDSDSINREMADYCIQAGHEYELIEIVSQLQYKQYL